MLISFPIFVVPLTDVSTHYVDPSNYDSVENVLKKFTKKLNEKDLKTEAIIGEGNTRHMETSCSKACYSCCWLIIRVKYFLKPS